MYDPDEYKLRELGASETARADAIRATYAKAAAIESERTAKPFRFEDLNGKPEPASWGPVYPKTASAAVSKWRMVANGRELSDAEKREYGAAVGEWIRTLNAIKPAAKISLEYKMPDFAAQARARFAADAARDRRAWALGKMKDSHGRTIKQAYRDAMAAKRAREATEAAQFAMAA